MVVDAGPRESWAARDDGTVQTLDPRYSEQFEFRAHDRQGVDMALQAAAGDQMLAEPAVSVPWTRYLPRSSSRAAESDPSTTVRTWSTCTRSTRATWSSGQLKAIVPEPAAGGQPHRTLRPGLSTEAPGRWQGGSGHSPRCDRGRTGHRHRRGRPVELIVDESMFEPPAGRDQRRWT